MSNKSDAIIEILISAIEQSSSDEFKVKFFSNKHSKSITANILLLEDEDTWEFVCDEVNPEIFEKFDLNGVALYISKLINVSDIDDIKVTEV